MSTVPHPPLSPDEAQHETRHWNTGVGLIQYLGLGLLAFSILMVIFGIVMILFMGPLGEP